MNVGNPRCNGEGYNDPTAYEATKNHDYERFGKLLRAIQYLCRVSGFRICGRITLVDIKSGKIWTQEVFKMESYEKEVDFHKYCPLCTYAETLTPEGYLPDKCEFCMSNPSNIDSRKPVNYTEKR